MTQPLPLDFDADQYLRMNPDVAVAGMAADVHYLQYGRPAGRRYLKRDCRYDGMAATLASSHYLPWPLRRLAARSVLRQHSLELLEARQSAVAYCCKSAPEEASTCNAIGPIWQYWAQGRENAPPIVQACLRSVERHAGEREVIVLSDRTISDHVDIPDHVLAKQGSMAKAHFSDVLRLALLSRYGGTWIDATVLLTDKIPEIVTASDLCVFRRDHDPFILSVWFMHAQRGHRLIECARAGLLRFWQANDRISDYFLFHHLIEASVILNRDLLSDYNAAPNQASIDAHLLQSRLGQPFNRTDFDNICRGRPLHKLTYKLDFESGDVETYWEAIVRLAGPP